MSLKRRNQLPSLGDPPPLNPFVSGKSITHAPCWAGAGYFPYTSMHWTFHILLWSSGVCMTRAEKRSNLKRFSKDVSYPDHARETFQPFWKQFFEFPHWFLIPCGLRHLLHLFQRDWHIKLTRGPVTAT